MPLVTAVDGGEEENIGEGLPFHPRRITSEYPATLWMSIAVSLLSLLSGIMLYNNMAPVGDGELYDPRSVTSLRKLAPYPNLDLKDKIQKTKGSMYLSRAGVNRVNIV